MRLSRALVFTLPVLTAASAVSSIQQPGDVLVEQPTVEPTTTRTEDVPIPTSLRKEHSLE